MSKYKITKYSTILCLFAGTLCLRATTNEPPRGPSRESLETTPAERDARLGWWRDARFGMFVHWGVYSSLGGTWHGRAYGGYGEHIQRMA